RRRRVPAVIAGIGKVDVSGTVALRGGSHVIAAARLRQGNRRSPAVSEECGRINVPPTLRRPVVFARSATRSVAKREPDATLAVVLQLWQFVVPLQIFVQRVFQRGEIDIRVAI